MTEYYGDRGNARNELVGKEIGGKEYGQRPFRKIPSEGDDAKAPPEKPCGVARAGVAAA